MKKLMIVDDDEVVEFCLRLLLNSHFPDVAVSSFSNGKEALEYIVSNNCADNLPDFILLDINMPVMDGWGFLKTISVHIEHLKKMPKIIMISSSSSKIDINRANDLPLVDCFITKPVTAQHLSSLL